MVTEPTPFNRAPSVQPTSKIKCLLVDDLPENLLALSALLRRDDVELLQARSGNEALELLLIHDVALAFLDVQMPEMDGFELAELMRGSERTQQVPIIFVTAGLRDESRLFRGYEAGAVDFLYKPIEPHILKSKSEVFFQLHLQKLQLAKQLQERTETLRLQEMFTAVLGHDLRNPLSALRLATDLVRRQSDNEAVRATALKMQTSVKRMSRMIEDLMDLARARLAGGIALKREPTDLTALAQLAIQEHQATFPSRQIALRQQGPLAGDWDGERLTQVISNLISNAIRHGDPAEPIDVLLDGTHEGRALIRVSNAGAIPPETIPHIFDPFQRGERPPGRTEGLGLGLYIVQQIAQAHGGRVSLDSSDAKRTVFEVELPRRLV